MPDISFALYQWTNATVMNSMNTDALIPASQVRAACDSILASGIFHNAPRMSRLLRFLVENAIADVVQNVSEYIIGIEVFDRNPSTYNTSEDPIVRVQIGRLREKLKTYYANPRIGSDIEISIPTGAYHPLFRRIHTAGRSATLAIYPFRCISNHNEAEHFMHGLHNELAHQLFKAFGKIAVVHITQRGADYERLANGGDLKAGIGHRLEGGIQFDAQLIRTSIRLVDASTDCITWSEQFNRKISLAIAHQEELASSICAALKLFFGREQP